MRPPRILIAILGLDQHETGALAVTHLLRDAGMEVVYLGRFGVPETIAAAAVDEGVDAVGLSCHSWEYVHYVDDLLERLGRAGTEIPVVLGGSVITPADARAFRQKGVAAVFGAHSTAEEIVEGIRRITSEPAAPGAAGG